MPSAEFMRILILTNLYPNPYEPNRSTFNRQQFRALSASHVLRIISPISWTSELRGRWRMGRVFGAERRWTCDGIAVEHPCYLFPPKVLRGWYGHFYRASVRSAFDRAVAEFKPDIVLAPWAFPDGWAAVSLGHAAGLPVVLKLHGCDVLNGGAGLDRLPSRKRRTVEALSGADGVIAVSQDLADHAVALGADPRRVRVVYDGIDGDRFNPGDMLDARHRLGVASDRPLILFIGNLIDVKAPDVLIDACAILSRSGLRFQCCMIGEGPLRDALQQRINSLGLNEQVSLLGSRPHCDLPDWYRAASLFVLPSFSEGVPCVLLEAIACGTPFVASRVGGIPEIAHLGQNRLVPPGDAYPLAGAIGAQLSSPRSANETAWSRGHADAAAEIADLLMQVLQERKSDVVSAQHIRGCV